MKDNSILDEDLFALREWVAKHDVDSYIILAVKDSANYFYCRGYDKNPFDLISVLELELLNYKMKVLEAMDTSRNKIDIDVGVSHGSRSLQ